MMKAPGCNDGCAYSDGGDQGIAKLFPLTGVRAVLTTFRVRPNAALAVKVLRRTAGSNLLPHLNSDWGRLCTKKRPLARLPSPSEGRIGVLLGELDGTLTHFIKARRYCI